MSSISVVVPTYNRGVAIQKTIDSVLNQTLAPLEIIVVDDGSTDGTADWIESHYGGQVRVIRQTNGGVARARNRGLQEAKGEFIAYLDHDDLWLPGKLEKQIEVMHQNPQVGVVYCLWRETDDVDQEIERAAILRYDEWEALPQGAVFARLMRHNFIISMTLPLIRTQLLREVGGFNPDFVPCDDWDVWLKLSRICDFAATQETLVTYVRHSNQQSKSESKMLEVARKLMLSHIRDNRYLVLSSPRILWIAFSLRYFAKSRVPHYNQARAAIRQRKWRQAYGALCRAAMKHPFIWLTPQWLYVLLRLITRNSAPF